jgi:hypothetical protein
MGYFANGFVFTSEPDFKAVAAMASDRCVRGYRYNDLDLWLLDIWKPRSQLKRHEPFCDSAATGFEADMAATDAPTQGFLETLRRLLVQLYGLCGRDSEVSYVRMAIAVASAARCPTFCFAADDEEKDMGCRTIPESLVSFGCRLDRLEVSYGGEAFIVTPVRHVEDNDEYEFEEMLGKVARIGGLSLAPQRVVEGGRLLYEYPVKQWPKEAGYPAELLGLGTWDPLLNVEADFNVVFERLI